MRCILGSSYTSPAGHWNQAEEDPRSVQGKYRARGSAQKKWLICQMSYFMFHLVPFKLGLVRTL